MWYSESHIDNIQTEVLASRPKTIPLVESIVILRYNFPDLISLHAIGFGKKQTREMAVKMPGVLQMPSLTNDYNPLRLFLFKSDDLTLNRIYVDFLKFKIPF